jgi:DNA-binding GntR family transcriptional regulator
MHLKDQAYEQVRDLVLSGELAPGDLLSERQLVSRLGMSKTPIRVALERLDRDGFLEILPQRGARIREPTEREIVDYYDFRIALESWIVKRATGHARKRDLQKLNRIVARQQKLLPGTGEAIVAPYTALDAEFHQALAETAGNAEIVKTMQTQRDKLALVLSIILRRNPEWLLTTTAEHERIVQAIESHDADLAEREIVEHLEHGKDFLTHSLAAMSTS